jgi:hypothetical protein
MTNIEMPSRISASLTSSFARLGEPSSRRDDQRQHERAPAVVAVSTE